MYNFFTDVHALVHFYGCSILSLFILLARACIFQSSTTYPLDILAQVCSHRFQSNVHNIEQNYSSYKILKILVKYYWSKIALKSFLLYRSLTERQHLIEKVAI
jgi:hypothetical protein